MEARDPFFQGRDTKPVTIFSIGHSNQPLEAFLSLLRQHRIQVLVDVRSSPYSKYVPHFNSTPLAIAVKQAGIKYMFMGKELGGRPDDDEFYDAESHVLYNCVALSSFFLNGIQRLKEGGKMYRVAIMCSEEDPTSCHRHLLIGRVLTEHGVNLLHIRGKGNIQTEEELVSREEALSYKQSLWGERASKKDEEIWRSIRPVSRKKTQPNSLGL